MRLVAGACVTSQRCALGLRVMAAGKDYFTDKAPLTTLEQLAAARKATAETGRKYMCYYSERLHVESAVYAGQLIAQGAIGKVLNVTGFGPHRLGAAGRPKWFFEKEKYGGILCDIGSHQIEQFLFFAGEEDARVQFSRVANYAHPEYPELEDYGDCSIVGANGATTISAWIGLPPMAFAPGGADAPLFWAPRAISRSASISTWRSRNGRAITCSW